MTSGTIPRPPSSSCVGHPVLRPGGARESVHEGQAGGRVSQQALPLRSPVRGRRAGAIRPGNGLPPTHGVGPVRDRPTQARRRAGDLHHRRRRPGAPINAQVLEAIASADFQTDLAQFNLEFALPRRWLIIDRRPRIRRGAVRVAAQQRRPDRTSPRPASHRRAPRSDVRASSPTVGPVRRSRPASVRPWPASRRAAVRTRSAARRSLDLNRT